MVKPINYIISKQEDFERGIARKKLAVSKKTWTSPKNELSASKNSLYWWFRRQGHFMLCKVKKACLCIEKLLPTYNSKFGCQSKFLAEQPRPRFVGWLWGYQRYTDHNNSKKICGWLQLSCPILGKYDDVSLNSASCAIGCSNGSFPSGVSLFPIWLKLKVAKTRNTVPSSCGSIL